MGSKIMIVHDDSEVTRLQDFYARQRELEARAITRAAVLHASWRPLLAGAVGAALIIAAVYVTLPKFSVRDVTVDHIIPHDVEVPHIILKDVEMQGPAVKHPAPDMGPRAPYAAKTPEENKFVDKPEYKNATYRGRIVKSRDGHELSFEDGMDFHPAHWDDAARKMVYDTDAVILSDEFIGDLGMCVPQRGHGEMFDCVAMHNGVETPMGGSRPINTSDPPARPTGPATEMIAVDIKVGGYPVEAMVDTGCAWPMAVPKVYADALIRAGLAARAGASSTTFADGSSHGVGLITIRSIQVDGRVLHDVEASVSPSNEAPILLGLGALNRLGPYTITDGKLVFTSERPA
jgi:hypothetical protein